jgi:hypothetical protein
MIARQDMENHIARECPEGMILCANIPCSWHLHRKFLEAHLKECEYRTRKCKYNTIDCRYEGRNGDVSKHEETEHEAHLRLAMTEIVSLRSKVQPNGGEFQALSRHEQRKMLFGPPRPVDPSSHARFLGVNSRVDQSPQKYFSVEDDTDSDHESESRPVKVDTETDIFARELQRIAAEDIFER